jgi:hypothetical protein
VVFLRHLLNESMLYVPSSLERPYGGVGDKFWASYRTNKHSTRDKRTSTSVRGLLLLTEMELRLRLLKMPRVPCDEMALYNTALSLINLARLSRTSTLPATFSETRDSVIF